MSCLRVLSLINFVFLASFCKCDVFNTTVPTLLDALNSVSNTPDISLKCLEQLLFLTGRMDVTITMLDASSKIPSGLELISPYNLGNYDECMTIDYKDKYDFRILGKHCFLAQYLPLSTTSVFGLSSCIPDACSANDMRTLYNTTNFFDDKCATKLDHSSYTTGAVITIAVYITIGAFILLSTLYDAYLYSTDRKSRHSALTAFSLVKNGRILVKTSKDKQQIHCFHGIKFISMMWIIAGHGAVGWKALPLLNAKMGTEWLNYRYAQYLNPAHLSVDSFFFISGFLLAYSYFKADYKKPLLSQVGAVPHLYLHRYLRLTPCLLMLYLYVTFLSPYVGSGPIFGYNIDALDAPCHKHWWSIFLYIQNYYNRKELCMTQLWYVSADMQLFILSPLISIPIALLYKKSFKVSMIALGALNVVFMVIPIIVKLCFKDYDPDLEEYDTHSRLTDYFIGFMFGMFVRHSRHNFSKFSKIINYLGWIVTLVVMYAIVFLYQEAIISSSYTFKVLIFCFTRTFWCIGLCWIVYSCINQQGGIINWILSNDFMQVSGKLTYCMYLLHGSVLAAWILSVREYLYLTNYNAFYSWCGHFIVSILLAVIWTLSFELPMITVEKLVFSSKPRPTRKTDPEVPVEAETKQS